MGSRQIGKAVIPRPDQLGPRGGGTTIAELEVNVGLTGCRVADVIPKESDLATNGLVRTDPKTWHTVE
jgi:hypothetical protein